MRPRFLLDEHIRKVVQSQLRRLSSEIEVLHIGDMLAPPRGTLDPAILLWTEQNGYILVSEDYNTMPGHVSDHLAATRHLPAVLIARPNTGIKQLVEELYMIWFASEAEEYENLIVYIPV